MSIASMLGCWFAVNRFKKKDVDAQADKDAKAG
jgi:hypothetical protein